MPFHGTHCLAKARSADERDRRSLQPHSHPSAPYNDLSAAAIQIHIQQPVRPRCTYTLEISALHQVSYSGQPRRILVHLPLARGRAACHPRLVVEHRISVYDFDDFGDFDDFLDFILL